jgi:hypothetical protein
MLFLTYYLWVVPHLLLVWVLLASLRRGRQRLPIFVGFIGFQIFLFIVLLTLSRLPDPVFSESYPWVLVIGTGIGSFLALGVIYELANELLLNRSSNAGRLRPLLRWALVLLILAAAISSGVFSGVSFKRVSNIFQILDFSFSLILAGMLFTLFLFSRMLHFSWRGWPTGVAVGFGISACINLAAAAMRAGVGKSAVIAVDITQMTAFHVSVVVWLIYLLLPDRTPAFVGRGLGQSDIQLWDQELQRMTGQ